jgi:hypothetical protein|tara:strand:+ start:526 stop:2691 length:2166 start_codon:yes stop_codon:yes gene_type:complete
MAKPKLEITAQATGGSRERNIKEIDVSPGQFGIPKISTTDTVGFARRNTTDYGALGRVFASIKNQEAYEKEKLDALIFDNNAIKNASEMKDVYEDMTSKKAIEEMSSEELDTYQKNLKIIMKTRYDHKYRDKSQKEKLTWGPVFERTLIALEKPVQDSRKFRASLENKKNTDDQAAVLLARASDAKTQNDIRVDRAEFKNVLLKKQYNNENVDVKAELAEFDAQSVIGTLKRSYLYTDGLNVIGDNFEDNDNTTDYTAIKSLISTKEGLTEFLNESGNYLVNNGKNTNAKGHLIDEETKEEILDEFGDPIDALSLTPELINKVRKTIGEESDRILKDLKDAATSHNKKNLGIATSEAIKISNDAILTAKQKKKRIEDLLKKYTVGKDAIIFKNMTESGKNYQKALTTQLKNIAKYGVLKEQTDTSMYDMLEAKLIAADPELLNKGAFYEVKVKAYEQVAVTELDALSGKQVPVLNDKGKPVTERRLVTKTITLLEAENYQTIHDNGDIVEQGLSSDQLERLLNQINNPNIKAANKEQNDTINEFIKDNLFDTLGIAGQIEIAKAYYSRRFKEGVLNDVKNKVGTVDNAGKRITLNTILYIEESEHYWKKQPYSQKPSTQEVNRKVRELLNIGRRKKGKPTISENAPISILETGTGPKSGFDQPGLKVNNISKGNKKITAEKIPLVQEKLLNYIKENPSLTKESIKDFVDRYGSDNLPKQLK